MCLAKPHALHTKEWNWDGDYIIHKCIVPSARPVVGYRKRHYYNIDVREFLLSSRNETIKQTIEWNIRRMLSARRSADTQPNWDRFLSRDPGSFDYKADVVTRFVSRTIRYTYRPVQDPWQFPDETLAIRNGDCEDRALLLASLLIASGISSYNVRVALGKLCLWDKIGAFQEKDHVWVMYRNEAGLWRVIEPLLTENIDKPSLPPTKGYRPILGSYMPYFVFNDHHLWGIRHGSTSRTINLKKTWSELHPSFTGQVHKSILEEALPANCPTAIRKNLLVRFTLLGHVDPIDTMRYDPIDHFDNGMISEGWTRVEDKLKTFRNEGGTQGGLDAFFHAAHSIADFYAHSSYCHFSKSTTPCDPEDPSYGLATPPTYDSTSEFDPASPAFSVNALLGGTKDSAITSWQGQIISGRYAQDRDQVRGDFEKPPYLGKKDLPLFASSLPHHEEIAVDGGMIWDGGWKPGGHVLYAREQYWQQLSRRKETAINHIRNAFTDNFGKPR